MKFLTTFVLLLLCTTPAVFSQQDDLAAIQQKHFSINDEINQGNLFSYENSKMLDTSSMEFKAAKSSVLKYCNERLLFKIDSVAIYYSCREYSEINPRISDEKQKWMEEVKLKYEFYITFTINSFIDYHLHFYLDNLLQVQDASKQLFTIKHECIWNIRPWDKISPRILKKYKHVILPLEKISLKYDPKHQGFVYVLVQGKTDKTKVHQTSDFSGSYQLNKLLVDAETGLVLEKAEQQYFYTNTPSW